MELVALHEFGHALALDHEPASCPAGPEDRSCAPSHARSAVGCAGAMASDV